LLARQQLLFIRNSNFVEVQILHSFNSILAFWAHFYPPQAGKNRAFRSNSSKAASGFLRDFHFNRLRNSTRKAR
jgi:hypothetical protein